VLQTGLVQVVPVLKFKLGNNSNFFPQVRLTMVLLDYSKKEAQIPFSIQVLFSKLILHLIGLMGSFEGIDRAEMHIRNQNTSKYLKFCQAILSQESFIEQDQDFEMFLFYFLKCSTMFADDQVRYELRNDIFAVAKDLEMDTPNRFLKYDIDEEDWDEFIDNLACTITGDEIDEYDCDYEAIFQRMMMNDVGKQGKIVVALCNSTTKV
jgi:hypothetical protein